MKISTIVSPILLLMAIILFNACDKEVIDTKSQANDISALQDTLPVATVIAGTSTPGYNDGPAAQAQFTPIIDVTTGSDGAVYILESTRIRKLKDGIVSTVAGTGTSGYKDGPCKTAQFKDLKSIGVCKDGTVYVIDRGSNSIRKITTAGVVSTYAGGPGKEPGDQDGTIKEATFRLMDRLAVSQDGMVYLSENGRFGPEDDITRETRVTGIRKITPEGIISTIAKEFTPAYLHGSYYTDLHVLPSGKLYSVSESTRLSYTVGGFTHYYPNFLPTITVTPQGMIYILAYGRAEVIYTPIYKTEEDEPKKVAIVGDDVEGDEEYNPDGISPAGLDFFGDDFYVGYGTQLKKVTILQ